MDGYCRISTETELNSFYDGLNGYHDAVLHEMHVLSGQCVDAEHSLFGGGTPVARCLIHSQCPPYSVEVLFIGVVDSAPAGAARGGATRRGVTTIVTTGVEVVTVTLPNGIVLSACEVYFRARPECLGPEAQFGEEIPRPDAVAASPLDSTWRLCGKCVEAFEPRHPGIYAVCPSCRVVTRLQGHA